jgi:sugar phosphate isomerase/epimerase
MTAAKLAELAMSVGAGVCITAVSQPVAREEIMDVLRVCGEILGGVGVRMALEYTAYGGLRTLSEVVELCAAIGWDRCGVLLDTWHFFRGADSWDMLRRLRGDQIALVHVDDAARPDTDDLVYQSRFRRLPPGEGTFPLREFAATLRELEYDGAISIEVLSSALRALPPRDGVRRLMTSMRASWPEDLPPG